MNNLWCVRAKYGKYTQQFVGGGYAAIGWLPSVQLVDLLVEYRSDIPQEFRDRLGLKPGLVRI